VNRCGFVFALALLACAQANGQFGPSQPRTNADERFSYGVAFRNTAARWTYGYDVDFSRALNEGSVAIAPGWELFVRLGASNYVVNDVELYRPGWQRDLSSVGYQFFAGVGARGLVWQSGDWSLGSTISFSRFSDFEKTMTVAVNAFQTVFVDAPLEIEFAAPITRRFGALGQYALYAGPQVHFGYIEGDVRTTTFTPAVSTMDEINRLNVRDKGSFGGFLGFQGPLFYTRGRWQIEGEAGAGFGGSISTYWSF
jgi:hypothetical protein